MALALLFGCSDHTLVGTIYKTRDTGGAGLTDGGDETGNGNGSGSGSGSGSGDGSGTDSGEPEDTGDPGSDRPEGTINLDDDWSARRIGELTAFQPKIDLAVEDLNGDGVAEVVVGAPGWLDPADNGVAYVIPGPMTGDGLLQDEVVLQGGDRIHYAGFTVDVGAPPSADYPVLAIGSYESVPDVFLIHGPITASGSLTTPDAWLHYTSSSGLAAWSGRDVSWVDHAADTWLLAGDPLAQDRRGAVRIHAGPYEGMLNQNGLGFVGGPTPRPEDNDPNLSCHTATTDASGAPVLFAAAPGVATSRGAVYRVSLSGTVDDLPVELDDASLDDRLLGTGPGETLGVFNNGWRCLLETGDITGDGVDDLVIGAPHTDGEAGMAWVVDGAAPWGGGSVAESPALLASVPGDIPDAAATPESCDGSCVGYGVELGDWDGDGAAELVVGRLRDFGAVSMVWYGPVAGTLLAAPGGAGSPELLVKGSGTEAKFADGDGDGDLDLFVAEGAKQFGSEDELLGQGGVWMIPGD